MRLEKEPNIQYLLIKTYSQTLRKKGGIHVFCTERKSWKMGEYDMKDFLLKVLYRVLQG